MPFTTHYTDYCIHVLLINQVHRPNCIIQDKVFPIKTNVHSRIFSGKRCWLLNTAKNVKVLERHVGKEVHDYMKERDSGTDDQVVSPHYVESQSLLEKQQLPEGTRKVSY